MPKRRRVSLEDETTVTCPYCSSSQLLVVDPDTTGELVQDCDVCCHPWTVMISRDDDGVLDVSVTRA
ncbi:MAG: CPXCG motif-containing cysteine-rich protein [Myxococcales bacterium]|nr:CPXCG motif-containing cysteine-rich protein [Myxococcales bacterium]